MEQKLQNTKNLVQDVFNKVYDKYDLMNNLMSFGIHKSWKKQLAKSPEDGQVLITGSRNGRQIYCAKLDLITCVTG